MRARRGALVGSLLALASCDRDEAPNTEASARTESTAAPRAPAAPSALPYDTPRLLFLPDAGDLAPTEAPFPELMPATPLLGRCPPEMVEISHSFCIDRYESSLRDTAQLRTISPYYHPEQAELRATHQRWLSAAARSSTRLGRSLEVPAPPAFQLEGPFDVRATSERGVTPNGYLDFERAARACKNAGKRLCTRDEWVLACRGERPRKFPYGESYEPGRCNVFREAHPAALLHGNASIHHLDPRLNLTQEHGRPLLRRTGETTTCRSEWGNDAVYDMVGNLDEWIDDPDGTFVGGFFSRATKEGCDAAVQSHPAEYYDYSLGTRCCTTP